MTAPSVTAVEPRLAAEHAAVRGLLNTYLRETRQHDPRGDDGALRVRLPASGRTLTGVLSYRSPLGHHDYGDEYTLDGDAAGYPDIVAAVLAEVAAWSGAEPVASGPPPLVAGPPVPAGSGSGSDELGRHRFAGRIERLAGKIENSTERIARYLACPRPRGAVDSRGRTRQAEQSVRIGHPMHPTPKSAEGFTDADLAAYAPELGTAFRLEYVAVSRELAGERRTAPGEWIPPGVAAAVPDGMLALPVHPWQARHLRKLPAYRALVDTDRLVPLGPLGDPVYPTSSVRSVCDPGFGTVWKLPLRVRITNFFRTNPIEHARRAADASALIAALRTDWAHGGFEVLVETGYRTVSHPDLAEDLTVIFRENPFTDGRYAPLVLAGLLEERPGEEPDLMEHLREAGGGSVTRAVVEQWLRRYLAISLVPALDLWSTSGVSLEAHVQNCLVHLVGGWPGRLWVRDMEGVSVSRQRFVRSDLLSADSPALYDDAEAWHRLRYYLVTNHLGHLLHVLGRHGGVTETRLWAIVGEVLAGVPGEYPDQLRRCPTLPVKANLTSRLADRGERPLYVDIPNPIREVRR